MRKKFKKGFTLLEIVISLGLMAIILIPTSNMVLGAVKGNKAGENKQQASMLLQETVEYLKTEEDIYDGLVLDNGVKITEVALTEAEKAEGKLNSKYKVESTGVRDNDYGIKVEGEIQLVVEVTEAKTDGIAIVSPEGNTNADVILRPVNENIYVTGDSLTIDEVLNTTGWIDNSTIVNPGDATNGGGNKGKGLGIKYAGDGIIKVEHKGFRTKPNSRNVLVVIDERSHKIEIDMDVSGGKAVTILVYITEGLKIEDYLVVNVKKGTANIVPYKPGSAGEDGEIVDNEGAKTYFAVNNYSIDLKGVKDEKEIQNVSVKLSK